MKNSYILVIINLLMILNACKKSESKAEITKIVPCWGVSDAETQQPLQNVLLQFGYFNSTVLDTYTDSEGYMCKDPGNFWAVTISKPGYASQLFYSRPESKIYFQRFSYIKYHVKNDAPSQSSDELLIKTPNGKFNYQQLYDELHIFGSAIDCTFVKAADRTGPVIWNTSVSGNTINLTVSGGDTTNIEIIY